MAIDPCLFCRIAAAQISAQEVFRDDRMVAFLDIAPIREGHVLIIPVAHHETFEVLPESLAADVMHLAQRIARVQKAVLLVPRVGFLYSGGDVAHAHAHLVPMWDKRDLTSRQYIVEDEVTFRMPPVQDSGALENTAARLREGLERQAS